MSRLEKIKIWSEEKKQKNIIAGEKQKEKKKINLHILATLSRSDWKCN